MYLDNCLGELDLEIVKILDSNNTNKSGNILKSGAKFISLSSDICNWIGFIRQ